MKKLINTALVYLIAGAAAGVFFREFTNFAQFTGQTTLGLMHPHLLVLGFAVFLIATLFALQDDFTGDKLFKPFYIVYNVGLVVTVCMMLVRGVVEVTGAPLAMPDAERGRSATAPPDRTPRRLLVRYGRDPTDRRPPPGSNGSPSTARPLSHSPPAWQQFSITDRIMDKNRLDSVIFSEDRSKGKPLTWHYKKRHSGLAEFGVKNY